MREIRALIVACVLASAQMLQGQMMQAISNNVTHAGGAATWTLIQHPNNLTCAPHAGGNESCTITASSTTAGNLLIFMSAAFTDAASEPTFVSASGDSTWTHCPSLLAGQNTAGWSVTDCAYLVSATGGATSFTYTWNFPGSPVSNAIDVELFEVHRSTGTATFDNGNKATSAACSPCTAPTITLSGSSDYIAQWGSQQQGFSSISGSYTNPAIQFENSNVAGGFAGAINQASGTGPSWTVSGSGAGAFSGIAFK